MPPTAYSVSIAQIQRAQGYVVNIGQSPYGWSKISGAVDTWNSLNHFSEIGSESLIAADASLRDKALIKALANLKNSQINLGVAFGERKRTAEYVADQFGRIISSVRNLKRGRIRNAMNDLGISHRKGEPRGSNWPQKWLEMQYAARPLYSDVYGAVSALSKRDQSDWRVTAKGSSQKEVSVTRAPPALASRNIGSYSGTLKGKCSVQVRIDALPQNDLKVALSSVGVTNPLLIAWELVPFSFVVDWALPIGAYLESLDSYAGYGLCYVVISERREGNWEGVGVDGYPSANSQHNGILNRFTESKRVFALVRTVSTSNPLPAMPRFKDPRSLSHLATSLSLLSTVFGGKRVPNYVRQ
jgi:hypothetical protein